MYSVKKLFNFKLSDSKTGVMIGQVNDFKIMY